MPSSMITCMNANASVQSVPGRTGSHTSASAAAWVRRGSMTTKAASDFASLMIERQNSELSD